MPHLGIDLGTTYSLAGYINAAGQVALIPDKYDANSFRTPSVVSINESGCHVGDAVEMRLLEDPSADHVRFVKLAMGDDRRFTDYHKRDWRPEAVSALILKKLLEDVASFLPDPVSSAVVTVPANFSDAQRQATKKAAMLAGISQVTLIEEPIAAATFYGMKDIRGDQTLFVYDLGGGTFDATLLQSADDGLFVLATDGQHDLGGKTVDEAIMGQLVGEYERLYGPLTQDNAIQVQLRQFATETKLELCRPGVTQVRNTLLLNNQAVDFLLTIAQFNRLIDKLVEQTLTVCQRCLEAAGMEWEFVDHILLTGGSSLLPLVRERLAERTGRDRNDLLLKQPHQAVAYGAALIADQLFGQEGQRSLQRATAWQLGIRVRGKDGQPAVKVMIDKNKPVPASESVTFYTTRANQPRMVIEVVQQKAEGEDEKSLGYFIFTLPDACPEKYAVEITLSYDLEGLVTAKARNPNTGEELKQVMDEQGLSLDDELLKQQNWVEKMVVNDG
ncbi:MAG: Hsp70 family protein [Pseudomonadota bacterium]|nr:Hsp70 family protein [Pseudomonadota bacterium]